MRKHILLLLALIMMPVTAPAAGDAVHPPHQKWGFQSPLGTYDRAALQRGYQVYRQVCAACHSMNRLAYRNLEALGYTEGQIKTLVADYTVPDDPNDEGEVLDRPARPSDRFVDPYPNRKAAEFVNNGAYPPDMSLLAKARPNGPDYIYALLTGYEEAPGDKKLLAGQYWNKYMPGHVIAMAPPLTDGIVAYEDDTPQTVEQYSRDLVEFLAWAADPHMEARKRAGVRALLFLFAFAGVLYAVKKKVWKKAH